MIQLNPLPDYLKWPVVLWPICWIGFLANVLFLMWPTPPPPIVSFPINPKLTPAAQQDLLNQLPALIEIKDNQQGRDEWVWAKPENLAPDGQTWTSAKLLAVQPHNRQPHTGKRRFSSNSKPTLHGPVNLNKATAMQLQALPGIGVKMAQRIVQYRSAHGPFTTVNQLMDVQGIGEKKLAKLKPFLTL